MSSKRKRVIQTKRQQRTESGKPKNTKYGLKHARQLRGDFNEASPLPDYRIKRIKSPAGVEDLNMKVLRGSV